MTPWLRAATLAAVLALAACAAPETDPVSLAPVPGVPFTITDVRARPTYSVALRERTAEMSGHDPNTVSFGFAVTPTGPLPAGAAVGVRFACQYGEVVYATTSWSAAAADLVSPTGAAAKGRAMPTPPPLLRGMPSACEATFASGSTLLGAACWTPGHLAAGACPAGAVRRVAPTVGPVALRDVRTEIRGASTAGFAVDVELMVTLAAPVPDLDARVVGDVVCEVAGKVETGALESTSPTLIGHLAPGESTYGTGQAFRVHRLPASPSRCELHLFLAHGGPLGTRVPLPPLCFGEGVPAAPCTASLGGTR